MLTRFIILTILVSFTGCVKSKIEYTEKNELPEGKVYRISEVHLKDGTAIDMMGKEPQFKLKYKGIENVIVYYNENNNELYMPFKDTKNMKIEVLKSNVLLSVIVIVGFVAVFFALILIYAFPFGKFKAT
ncbi:MAG: hypothetical protein K8I03_15235 [Ignavibacteria bacterium]|nr:hypothetical protein [Ignavibacteria bacterium]